MDSEISLCLWLKLYFRMSNRPGDYTIEELRNPDPETRPFTPGDIIAISLSIARFYFMGTNPVFARLIKKTVDITGITLGSDTLPRCRQDGYLRRNVRSKWL